MSDDERIDIVNENRERLHEESKIVAHEKGLMHMTVLAELIDSEGKWTLVQQSASRQDPGQFVSPVGGHVKVGESLEEALKREAEEELGLTGNYEFKFIKSIQFRRKVLGRDENHLFQIFHIHADHTPTLNEEGDDFKKFSEDELRQLLKEKPEMFGGTFHFFAKNVYGFAE
jgi:8-oxo-dGTP pyrophosphatase MutT (NUDIX family)